MIISFKNEHDSVNLFNEKYKLLMNFGLNHVDRGEKSKIVFQRNILTMVRYHIKREVITLRGRKIAIILTYNMVICALDVLKFGRGGYEMPRVS